MERILHDLKKIAVKQRELSEALDKLYADLTEIGDLKVIEMVGKSMIERSDLDENLRKLSEKVLHASKR